MASTERLKNAYLKMLPNLGASMIIGEVSVANTPIADIAGLR